ncbi:MAG: helix-turn-helix domain-containing protein [bacterium]|nr:helix-turn-helix domain-containing protein [bacterium]
MPEKLVYSVNEVAGLLGLSRNSIYTLMSDENRGFPIIRIGRRIIIPRSAFLGWLHGPNAGEAVTGE